MRIPAASRWVGWVLVTALPCQVPIWTRLGTPPPVVTVFSGPLTTIGDVNGDGYRDVMQFIGGYLPPQGLWMFSGRDGTTLRMQPPFLPNHGVRTMTSTGDMNGDGIGDYALGYVNSQLGNVVQVRSASNDALLWQVQGAWLDLFGIQLAGDLDTNHDGLRDLVVGAERQNNFAGAIRVYNNNGTLRYTIANLPGVSYLGRSLAKVGDVNGDGCDDFVAGAVANVGVVILFSGLTGAELRRGLGDPDGVLGWSVTGCGDMDGDGVPDFAGGTSGGFGERGLVRVFSGATGGTIYSWWSPSSLQFGNGFGREVFGGNDVDRDGVPDVLIAASDYEVTWTGTAMSAYSGRDGSRLFRLILPAPGYVLAAQAPQPGNPFPVFIASWAYLPPGTLTDTWAITMYRASPPGVEAFGSACAGTLSRTPRIGIHGTQQGQTRIHLSNGEPGGLGVLLLGVSSTAFAGLPLPFPLSGYGFSGCMLSTSIDAFAVVGLGSTGNAAGYGVFDLPVPPAATGFAVHGQWLALSVALPGTGGVTDALRWRL